MKLKFLSLMLSVSLIFLSSAQCFAATAPKTASKGASPAKPPTPASTPASASEASAPPHSATLSDSIKAYKAQPDPEAWDKSFADFYNFLGQNPKASAASIIAGNPSLRDVGASCVDGGGAKIWTFTKVPDNTAAIVLWQNVTPGPEQVVRVHGRKRIVRGEPTVSWKGQMMRLPAGLTLKDARLVRSAVSVTPSASTGISSAMVAKRTADVDYVRALVLSGVERNGNTWLHAYRQSGSSWNDAPELFSGVPPFLLQNLAGKVTFNGNDLIVSVGMPTPLAKVADESGKGATTSSGTANGYRLVLHFISGKYVLDGKTADDGPFAVAQQFATAVAQNRVELAKGWMAEGKLIAIPQYAGLLGHSPLRVMPMANPGNGNSRFRLVSFLKEDLIIDIGKIKTQQLAVKAIYVAPADPLAQKLLGTLNPPAPTPSTSTAGASSSNADAPAADAK
ncbi:MAG: hypothetical protein P4L53_21320 [Candidatus Obscuribacterales bacterium]|nr:hypothetical protein [Candidatus Obscuribacterales bacterium]